MLVSGPCRLECWLLFGVSQEHSQEDFGHQAWFVDVDLVAGIKGVLGLSLLFRAQIQEALR